MARLRFDPCARAQAVATMLGIVPSLHADPGDLDRVTAGQAGAAVGGHTVTIFQAVSDDGRYVLFSSASGAIVPNDGNDHGDLLYPLPSCLCSLSFSAHSFSASTPVVPTSATPARPPADCMRCS